MGDQINGTDHRVDSEIQTGYQTVPCSNSKTTKQACDRHQAILPNHHSTTSGQETTSRQQCTNTMEKPTNQPAQQTHYIPDTDKTHLTQSSHETENPTVTCPSANPKTK
eukprot:scaffold25015_cov23-Attheya_sp.AAC.1